MSTQPANISPQELMRQAAQKGKEAEVKDEVKDEANPVPSTPSSTPSILNPTGKIYRLLSYPMMIAYGGQRHVFHDGIVRPFSAGFSEEMDKLVKIGAATVITQEEALRLEKRAAK